MPETVLCSGNAVKIFDGFLKLFGFIICKSQFIVVVAGSAGILVIAL